MHHKKSEAQIGLESSGVSSDFNPTPPSSLTHKHPHPSLHFHPTAPPSSPSSVRITINDDDQNRFDSFAINPASSFIPNYHQHPFLSNSVANTSRLYNSNSPTKFDLFYSRSQKFLTHFRHHLRHLRRRLRLHLRLILLLSLPFFYFLVSHPSSSFILDFLSAFAFSAALLFSLNLAIPRLPTIRMFLASLPIKISAKGHVSQAHVPVYWSIGSWRKAGKGLISGCYVQTYSNGDVYEGEIHKGKCNGSGVYYYYMAGRYEGDWVDEKYDGYGVETWARGSRYRGQCKQGLRNGFGMYRFYTGDVYAGEWSNGQCHGCGIHTCEDGSRYVGEFKWGVKHGLGHYHFRNGDRYGGEYFADKMHGFGVYYFANGHRYEGAWHEGRRQGLGMYTFRNGETQSGHWQNGILDVPSTHSNICPVSPVAVNHSKVLNAIQEARRAADKAHELPKVDERVNRAVAAANKAANAARVAAVKAVQKQLHHGRRRNSDDIPIPVSRAFAIDDDPQLTISNRLLP